MAATDFKDYYVEMRVQSMNSVTTINLINLMISNDYEIVGVEFTEDLKVYTIKFERKH